MNEIKQNSLSEEIKKYLKIKEKASPLLPMPKLDDDELDLVTKLKIQQLEQMIGISLHPVERIQYSFNRISKIFLLDHYPVIDIKKITANGNEIKDYILSKEEGIINFNRKYSLPLRIEYVSGIDLLSKEVNLIDLICDMIQYDLSNKGVGSLLSLKEGTDVVSFDSSTSKGNEIKGKIEHLRNKYACRMTLI